MNDDSILRQLMHTIEDRRVNPLSRSYTSMLFDGGVDMIGGKIMEEAGEVVEAAHEPASADATKHLIHEAADLIYHLMVMLAYRDVGLAEIEAELGRRFGTSGLDERATRFDE